ncbi:phosphoglycerate dehydrogenase [Marinoscillum sp. MHG1-6]|uniref:phosphoglycerate dehydrogenase n=1 Tax=Marinoscillum sp. MHG1-6 TaxID=2959627 RepID=UPI002156FC77|nr:phosphoglycerate dehydrogenase [Marinoscillum sp. MHG1-6]
MENLKHFVIDFDSTFTRVEALDVLCEVSLNGHPNKDSALQKIKEITDLGMEGKLSLRESLEKRLDILQAKKEHLPELINRLSKEVSESFKRNKDFVKKYADEIYIVSNGFKDFIVPIVEQYGINPDQVYANEFTYDDEGNITGFDPDNLLSSNGGKPKQIQSLNLQGEIFVLGDGYTDYEIKKAGIAHKFYAFTENIRRENVLENADHEAPTLDEFLYVNKMERALSYPKNRIKVLLLENIHDHGIKKLKEEGYQVEVYPAGMSEEELSEAIKDVSILGIRSKTQVTAKVLENANRLLAVGAFCIGTNQIDLNTCLRKGIAVFNAPYSNTRSVVELAIGEIIMLMRNLPDKIKLMHEGNWDKSAKNSFEIRGKKLGIFGYGNIGSQLSVVAESLGLKVQFYDIEEKLALGNAEQCKSLDEFLETSDVITLHVDGRPTNKNIFGESEFSKMKDGVIFLNLSRGHVVDIAALKKYIVSGKIKGAGIDVFPEEPMSNNDEFISELRSLPNTILTPHIGGSTLEAQEMIADFVPGKIMDYINTGSTSVSVNFPNIVLPKLKDAHRFIHIHKNEPGVLAEINNELAKHDINVVGQYLKTNEEVGYVITDINKDYDSEVIKNLKKIKATIRFRVLY